MHPLLSCNRQGEIAKMVITGEISQEEIEQESVREILYNLYQPEEMSKIFDRTAANFDPDIPASPDNFPAYNTSFEMAVALGIYGVDLYYSRLFDQTSYTSSYITAIQILSEKIGIPESYYEGLFEEPENWLTNRDSVALFASDIYIKTDTFLKKNDKDALSALIVMGSWIEAMFIASRIYSENPSNMEILDRIAEQKYSLSPLISLLSNYQDDLRIRELILMLNKLRKSFDRFEIYFHEPDLTIDTTRKIISAGKYRSDFTTENATEIITLVQEIRLKLVR
jgi:hypothetical protein